MMLFGITMGIASGIIFRSLFIFSLPTIAFGFFLGSILLFHGIFFRAPRIIMLSACTVAFGVGVLVMHTHTTQYGASLLTHLETQKTLEGVVVRNPELRERALHAVVSLEEDGLPQNVRVLAFLPRQSSVSYGDRIILSGTLAVPEDFETDTGIVFRYREYLLSRGVSFVMFRAEIVETLGKGEGSDILRILYRVREVFIKGLSRSLPEPYASLGAGITVGAQEGLGTEVSEKFRTTGLTHVVVLSGYNLTVVAEAVMRIAQLALPFGASLIVGGVAIILFALASGAAPPALRAMLMALIGLFARATGRTYDAFRGLCVAVIIMLLISPRVLLSDPGFQLSVLATLGMILVAPIVERYLPYLPLRFGIRSLCATTLGVYITVLPLLMYLTGEISTVSFPANVLVLPIIPYAMLAVLFASIGGIIFPSIVASMVGVGAYAFLLYMLFVAETLSSLPFASFLVPHVPLFALTVFYFSFFLFVYYLQNKER